MCDSVRVIPPGVATRPAETVELTDPRRDPEPPGWAEFQRREGLSAVWSYEVLRRVSESSWTPALLGVCRTGGQIVGAVGAVQRGVRSTRPPGRWGPLLLDVRLPGHGAGPAWHFAANAADAADDAADATDRARLMRAFERAAARRLGWGLTGVVYRHVTEPEVPLLVRRGAIVRDSSDGTEMAVGWSSVEEWTRSLAKNRRASLRRRARSIEADETLRVAFGPGRTDLDPAEMADLAKRHGERLQGRLDRRDSPPAAYFAALLGRDDVSVLSYTEADRLLAYGVLFHGAVRPALSWWASVPVEEGGRKHLYFDSYLRYVRHAIENGATALAGGPGRPDLKEEVGFRRVPMKLVLVPRWAMG